MKNLLALLSLLLALFITQATLANEGYVEISPAQPTETDDKIEVLEVFWYACPHCYDFEPHINRWLANKADDVEFRRMPGIFRKSWIPHAKAYYTASKLDVIDKIHSPLFDAIHREKKKIYDDGSLEDFFEDQGIDKKSFTRVYESDEVDTKVKQAFVMGQRYKITGVPAVIVNGKYLITGSTAGSFENMLKVIDTLVVKERTSIVN